jgi:hypothetical protein
MLRVIAGVDMLQRGAATRSRYPARYERLHAYLVGSRFLASIYNWYFIFICDKVVGLCTLVSLRGIPGHYPKLG